MKCVLVDDEKHARENLRFLLENSNRNLEIVGEASNVDDAYDLICKVEPDVVFLDISMPEKDGFQLLEMFKAIQFETVFVTAYDRYAMQAFEHLASAYILKPIDEDILFKVLDKVNLRRPAEERSDELKTIKKYLETAIVNKKLGIPVESGLILINPNDISYLESDSGYTKIVLSNGTKHVSSKRLNYFADRLGESQFTRVHQSFIVNLQNVQAFRKNNTIKMADGSELPVSRSQKKEVLSKLS